MILGITKEPQYDNRVSVLPELIEQIKKLNLQVIVEKSAGERAFASDDMYYSSGAEVLSREGIPVARRTVAKYRESMGIAPSNERKRGQG